MGLQIPVVKYFSQVDVALSMRMANFPQREVETLRAKAVELEGSRQKAKAKLVAYALSPMFQAKSSKIYSQSGPSDIKELFILHGSLRPKAHVRHEGCDIATCQSRKLRQQAKGRVETFLWRRLTHAVAELRPRPIVAERLDLRDGGLAPELNRLIASTGPGLLGEQVP